jgi:hypothetical protein
LFLLSFSSCICFFPFIFFIYDLFNDAVTAQVIYYDDYAQLTMNRKGYGRKTSWCVSKYYCGMHLEELWRLKKKDTIFLYSYIFASCSLSLLCSLFPLSSLSDPPQIHNVNAAEHKNYE